MEPTTMPTSRPKVERRGFVPLWSTAVIALALLAGTAIPASALSLEEIWEELEKRLP
jgi:hypothetical protein